MATSGFVMYLLAAFLFAVGSIHFVQNLSNGDSSVLAKIHGSQEKVWPELKFNWQIVLATVIGFVGSAFGTVGGVGGGGLFLPTLTLIVGFDTKSAAALSKCMIMGATVSAAWYNLTVPHPFRQVPIVDYDLALLFQPMLMLGITIGVPLSVIFPYWLITVLIIVLFIATSSRSFAKAIAMWKEETIVNSRIDAACEPLVQRPAKTPWESLKCNLDVRRFSMLFTEWFCFILIQVIKKHTEVCSKLYWGLTFLQLPIAFCVLGYECTKIYKENKRRKTEAGHLIERASDATIDWNVRNVILCACCGLFGGIVGGLLGSGAGFVIGPFLLEIGLIPQVASATATFSMMFSVTLSVTEFYLLNRFPVGFAMYMVSVCVLAGFLGQYLVLKLVEILRRASIIVFILSGVIFVSAITMGVIGMVKSIGMIGRHEFMGFLDYCSNQ